jgi:hypothetical protein
LTKINRDTTRYPTIQEPTMSHASSNQRSDAVDQPDAAEAIVGVIPWLIPVAGAILMFLLAFIAVVMA